MATGLAVVAAAVARLCRRPALGHATWLLVLLKLITPPLVVIPIALPEPAKEDEPVALVELSPLPAEREVPAVAPDQAQRPPAEEPLPAVAANVVEVADPFVAGRDWRDLQPVPQNADGLPAEALAASGVDEVAWRGLVGGVWLAGSAIWFLIALTRIGRFHRLLRASQPGPTGLQQETNGLALQMGLRDCPGIWLIPGVLSPLLWAVYGCPRLLFPVGLLQRVNDVQRRTLLAHELAHYRRRDHWVRCLEFLRWGCIGGSRWPGGRAGNCGGGGRMLRRLGDLDAAGRCQGVCERPGGNARFSGRCVPRCRRWPAAWDRSTCCEGE